MRWSPGGARREDRTRCRGGGLIGAGLIALVLAGCGVDGPLPNMAGAPGAGEPASMVYDCYGIQATGSQLREAPPVAEVDHPGVDAFADYTDDLDGWQAVVVEDERLAAIRRLDQPDVVDGAVRDHERLEVTRLEEPAPPETDEDGWMVSSSGPCALQTDLGGLGPASVHLDGDTFDAAASQLPLLVVEQACASGEDAGGRMAVEVDADQDEIRLLVGVEPRGGDQTCPSNPATPVAVDLDEPVGDRRVVDVARYPPREVTEAADDADVPELGPS